MRLSVHAISLTTTITNTVHMYSEGPPQQHLIGGWEVNRESWSTQVEWGGSHAGLSEWLVQSLTLLERSKSTARLWLYSHLDLCMKHYIIGILFAFYFHFASTPVPSPDTRCPIPKLSGRGMFDCMHSQCCIWLNLNLIAFIIVIMMCHLAVALHKYIFRLSPPPSFCVCVFWLF